MFRLDLDAPRPGLRDQRFTTVCREIAARLIVVRRLFKAVGHRQDARTSVNDAPHSGGELHVGYGIALTP